MRLQKINGMWCVGYKDIVCVGVFEDVGLAIGYIFNQYNGNFIYHKRA